MNGARHEDMKSFYHGKHPEIACVRHGTRVQLLPSNGQAVSVRPMEKQFGLSVGVDNQVNFRGLDGLVEGCEEKDLAR